MFTRSLNMYSIGTFDKNHYKQIIKNIEKSKGYTSYIDSKKNKGVINPRYKRYLEDKLMLYTLRPKDINESSVYFALYNDSNIDNKKLNRLEREHGVQDDYYLDETVVEAEEAGVYVKIRRSVPVEMNIFEKSQTVDDHLERINREQLSKDFVMNNHRRFMLLPFVAKDNEEFVEPLIIANIYDTGIVTIQLILSTEYSEVLSISERAPRILEIDEARFYKVQDNYQTKHFWEKETKYNLTADDIMNYYEEHVSKLGNFKIEFTPSYRPVSWVFNDFFIKKKPSVEEFVQQHKKLYLSHLLNGQRVVIDRFSEEKIDEILTESEIVSNKHVHYICNPTSSIVSFNYSAFLDSAEDSLKEQEKELKANGLYETSRLNIFKDLSLIAMLEYLRFYELSFIRKYSTIKLLKNLSSGKYKTLDDYNLIRKDFNFVKLQYDEEILFHSEGSAKNLYKDILEKSGANNLVNKAEDIVKGIREDTINLREKDIKNNETSILILTTLLTIILGYRGVKEIIYEVAIHLPVLGQFIGKHPFRYTLVIWAILIIIMLVLNIKRWRNIRK